jgi:hypothetical protein
MVLAVRLPALSDQMTPTETTTNNKTKMPGVTSLGQEYPELPGEVAVGSKESEPGSEPGVVGRGSRRFVVAASFDSPKMAVARSEPGADSSMG